MKKKIKEGYVEIEDGEIVSIYITPPQFWGGIQGIKKWENLIGVKKGGESPDEPVASFKSVPIYTSHSFAEVKCEKLDPQSQPGQFLDKNFYEANDRTN